MPRIFGQEIQGKTLWIILGVIAAGVAVVVYVRSQASGDAGGAVPQAAPDGGFGGGGGGIPVSAPTDDAANNYNAQLAAVQLDAAKFGLEQQKQEAAQAQKAFDLNATLQEGYNNLQLALFGQQQQVGQAQAAYGVAAYKSAEAAEGVVQRTIAGKKKVECPPGQHFVVLADGSTACQQKGGGGFNFSTITKGIADIATGLFGGAAAAAPGIGYSAANAWAGQIMPPSARRPVAAPKQPSGANPGYTPNLLPQGQVWA